MQRLVHPKCSAERSHEAIPNGASEKSVRYVGAIAITGRRVKAMRAGIAPKHRGLGFGSGSSDRSGVQTIARAGEGHCPSRPLLQSNKLESEDSSSLSRFPNGDYFAACSRTSTKASESRSRLNSRIARALEASPMAWHASRLSAIQQRASANASGSSGGIALPH